MRRLRYHLRVLWAHRPFRPRWKWEEWLSTFDAYEWRYDDEAD